MTQSGAQAMKARMRADLRDAMKARRTTEAKVIRALIAAIDNAEAPPLRQRPTCDQVQFVDGSAEISRLSLDQDSVRTVLAAEIRERENASAEMAQLGTMDRAQSLREEALLIERYLA